MGTNGCVSYLFDTKGVILIEKKSGMDDDEMMMTAIDSGADDFNVSDGLYEITTLPSALSQVREALESKGFVLAGAEVEKIPANTVDLSGADLEKFTRMLDMFDDNDDVQDVFHNANLPDEGDDE